MQISKNRFSRRVRCRCGVPRANLRAFRNRSMFVVSVLTNSRAIGLGSMWSSRLTVRLSSSMLTVPPISISYGLSPGS